MHSDFNLFAFPNSMFTPLLLFFFRVVLYPLQVGCHIIIIIIMVIFKCYFSRELIALSYI